MSFWPMNRWFGAMILLFTTYIAYSFVGPVVETTLPQYLLGAAADDVRYSYVVDIVNSTTRNFWYGVLALFGGYLLYLFISGIPGNQEESWQNY